MKNISIIGSTGSIGVQTLNVVRNHKDKFNVVALSAGRNEELLLNQTEEFLPDFVGINGKFGVKTTKFTYFEGDTAAEEIACLDNVDIVVVAIVGMAALKPIMAAIKKGKLVALANKEALVCFGDVIMREAKKHGAEIFPIDSEHSALFQCLKLGSSKEVKKLIITASGGAYYGKSETELDAITPELAVKHPTWNMGQKISIDSATMVNKGLELIEAYRLYDCKNIDYVVHPQSIIHSLVEYVDGSTFAQLSYPNMELAIQYALTYPDRLSCDGVKPFDFCKDLTFVPKNPIFRAPEMALSCINAGGTAPALYNIANEIAVELFMRNKIKFTQIVNLIDDVLNTFAVEYNYDINRLFELSNEISDYLKRD